jgi:hypothetical protein
LSFERGYPSPTDKSAGRRTLLKVASAESDRHNDDDTGKGARVTGDKAIGAPILPALNPTDDAILATLSLMKSNEN